MTQPRIAIEGIGITGAFGTGLSAFRAALGAGVTDFELFSVDPGSDACKLPGLKAKPEGLGEFVNRRALRRIDYFSRLAILGVGLAIRNAGMWEHDRSRMGMVLGTGYGATSTTFGFMNSMLEFGDSCASPTKFSNSVHNAAGANAAINLKLEGVNLTISQFGMSVPIALVSTIDWLRSDNVDAIVFGGVDEYCRTLGYCHKRYFGEHVGPMEPLAFDRQTAIPGEGAAFFMMRSEENAKNPIAFIDVPRLGHVDQGVEIPADGVIFIGANGHKDSGRWYDAVVPTDRDVRCMTPVYGSFPAAAAFDLAAAVLHVQETGETAHCLTIDCEGKYALTTLSTYHEREIINRRANSL